MKISVGLKVFSVALVLMALVGAVAWINARSAREVVSLIANVHETYVPAYGDLARGGRPADLPLAKAKRRLCQWKARRVRRPNCLRPPLSRQTRMQPNAQSRLAWIRGLLPSGFAN